LFVAGPSIADDEDAAATARQELLRSAAKWLIGSLGAIGAVLVAGSQLSSIGSLPAGPRLTTAVVGLAVGLGGVLLSVAFAVGVLADEQYSVTELQLEWERAGFTRGPAAGPKGLRRWWLRRRYPVAFYFAENQELLAGHESPNQLYEHSVADASDADDAYVELNKMLSRATFRREMVRFSRSKKWIFLGVAIASLGITIFAWAANPGKVSTPSLRNANLTNADLHGVNLRSADLTGANLTNANLKGANLQDAVIKDAIWKNTTCPDGTNSDSTGRPDNNNVLSGGTCEGHLEP
jgi:hypothetical protein